MLRFYVPYTYPAIKLLSLGYMVQGVYMSSGMVRNLYPTFMAPKSPSTPSKNL
jgi:hypothetical protein